MESRLVPARSRDGGDLGIKDPSIVPMPDGSFIMYATVSASDREPFSIGRFHASHPGGPWTELEPPVVEDVYGPEVCAPSVSYDPGQGLWTMYVQTSCFHPDGVIAVATSTDGIHFKGAPVPVMAKESLPADNPYRVVGLYDVAVSEIEREDGAYECMVFSGYRRLGPHGRYFAGSGDLYLSMRKREPEAEWSQPELLLEQESVPFHNDPDSPTFEWGLEGAKIVQLDDDAFVLVGVCFLDKGNAERGNRQRVFMAAASSPAGPFHPMGMPLEPDYPGGKGENGHPDMIDLGERIGILYQERAGLNHRWHLRYAEIEKRDLLLQVRARLDAAHRPPPPQPPPFHPPGPMP